MAHSSSSIVLPGGPTTTSSLLLTNFGTRQVVIDALDRDRAAREIQRVLQRWHHQATGSLQQQQQRRIKRRRTSPEAPDGNDDNACDHYQHWLIQRLDSPQAHQRSAAIQAMLRHCASLSENADPHHFRYALLRFWTWRVEDLLRSSNDDDHNLVDTVGSVAERCRRRRLSYNYHNHRELLVEALAVRNHLLKGDATITTASTPTTESSCMTMIMPPLRVAFWTRRLVALVQATVMNDNSHGPSVLSVRQQERAAVDALIRTILEQCYIVTTTTTASASAISGSARRSGSGSSAVDNNNNNTANSNKDKVALMERANRMSLWSSTCNSSSSYSNNGVDGEYYILDDVIWVCARLRFHYDNRSSSDSSATASTTTESSLSCSSWDHVESLTWLVQAIQPHAGILQVIQPQQQNSTIGSNNNATEVDSNNARKTSSSSPRKESDAGESTSASSSSTMHFSQALRQGGDVPAAQRQRHDDDDENREDGKRSRGNSQDEEDEEIIEEDEDINSELIDADEDDEDEIMDSARDDADNHEDDDEDDSIIDDDMVDDDDDDEDDDDDDDSMQGDSIDYDMVQGLIDGSAAAASHRHNGNDDDEEDDDEARATLSLDPPLETRQRLYIRSCCRVLHKNFKQADMRLSIAASDHLLASMNAIIRPPKKPLSLKVALRRAPTQEEFFRGSLHRNPLPLAELSEDPTVEDLRLSVATDLQMADSAEMIEFLVAGKIVDVKLKLRVIHQTVWRDHLIAQASAVASAGSNGSALSVLLLGGGGAVRTSITSETALKNLPPMVATYRLVGVDGEATEDTVTSLVDPEEPNTSCGDSHEQEQWLEEQYGLTRLVLTTTNNGVGVLLHAIQQSIQDVVRRIRRDDVGRNNKDDAVEPNPTREAFRQATPGPGLMLLNYCSKLSSNRQLLLLARAPTILLTLLLDVLKALEDPFDLDTGSGATNPCAQSLQNLIEVLTSDLHGSASTNGESIMEDICDDSSSMPLLLESIETVGQRQSLRDVIAKLLPYLTYGQPSLSRELAQHFHKHVVVDRLATLEKADENRAADTAIMSTFVQTAINLPPNSVGNSLRTELLSGGLVDRLVVFVLRDVPKQPPPWSPALWSKRSSGAEGKGRKTLETKWKSYLGRGGIRMAMEILSGLGQTHQPTQQRLAQTPEFLRSCHWLEATSSNTGPSAYGGGDNDLMNGLGLLAETLLDEIVDMQDAKLTALVHGVRKKTSQRKKELAQERRNKALRKMSACVSPVPGSAKRKSLLDPIIGLLGSSKKSAKKDSGDSKPAATAVPAWMAEMEAMEDETGLTCAVCQEGRSFQPKEPLGLYAYVRKIIIPSSQGGSRYDTDGTALLKALPSTCPHSMVGTPAGDDWYAIGKAAAEDLAMPSSSSSSIRNFYTTTVSAGNAIHFSCHRRARTADRNHSKAPKSEWEGAKLRNSRCSANCILPLVASSKASSVPLVAVEQVLGEYHSMVGNLLGSSSSSSASSSMLWTVLHDVRLLLLRVSYGESLSIECGGGSLTSNLQLVFYQIEQIQMLERNARLEGNAALSQHTRCLTSGFLAACTMVDLCPSIIKSGSSNSGLVRHVADAAPMACLTAIAFMACAGDDDANGDAGNHSGQSSMASIANFWEVASELFLKGLLLCAGRRHALGISSSGCLSGKKQVQHQRLRSNSKFCDWTNDANDDDDNDDDDDDNNEKDASLSSSSSGATSSGQCQLSDFGAALRPLLTYYIVLRHLATQQQQQQSFGRDKSDKNNNKRSDTTTTTDETILGQAESLTSVVEKCHLCASLEELLAWVLVAKPSAAASQLTPAVMLDYVQKGILAAV